MDVAPDCVPQRITDLLRKHLPNLKIHSHVGSELAYQLPENESKKFEAMFSDLESHTGQLGVRSFGVSVTTLEEVFMKVGVEGKDGKTPEMNVSVNEQKEPKVDYLEGLPLAINQFKAMVLKKFYSQVRSWVLFLLQTIFPTAFLVYIFWSLRGDESLTKFPALPITLDSYENPVILISGSETEEYIVFKKMFQKEKVNVTGNIGSEMLKLTRNDPVDSKFHYIVGASFKEDVTTAWFNGEVFHSEPLALSLMLNVRFKIQMSDYKKSITFINHPQPLSPKTQYNEEKSNENERGRILGIVLGITMPFIAAFYIFFYTKERVCKSKHQQFISGVNAVIFWCTSLIWDMVTFLITIIPMLIIIAAIEEDNYKSAEFGPTAIIFISFGFQMLALMYLLSYLFNKPSTGFSRTMLIGFIFGVMGPLFIQMLRGDFLGMKVLATPLDWIFLFIPFYSICMAMNVASTVYTYAKICDKLPPPKCQIAKICCEYDYYSLKQNAIGRNVLISMVMWILLFTILIVKESGQFRCLTRLLVKVKTPIPPRQSIDSDVAEENQKIRKTSKTVLTQQYILVMHDLTKFYKKIPVVNGLCLGVKPYECFGLLGVNGAGKTSTFQMMTGEVHLSYGEVWINGYNIKRDQKKVHKLIGYCPQFDALLDDLTPKETLTIFALIRGVPYNQCKLVRESLAREFDFTQHLNKKIEELSGGNKRKVSTALALIGDPPLIFLDEPTAGMDPVTKRNIWTAICRLRDKGKCIILTSHSMDECEALCTRMAIMVSGSFRCLGSAQRLKNKFAQGYSLIIKVKRVLDEAVLKRNVAAVEKFVQDNFAGAVLKEQYLGLLSYQLENISMPWSKMFGIMERNKGQLGIDGYSLGQCSLEQVFLSFTDRP